MMSPEIQKRILSRKFVLSVLIQVCGTAALGLGGIDGEQWTQLSMVNLGGFTLGNACEHLAGRAPA